MLQIKIISKLEKLIWEKDNIVILGQGRVGRKKYKVEKQSFSNRKIDPKLENLIAKDWKEIKLQAKNKGLEPWDGLYCRLENYNQFKNGKDLLKISDSIRFSQIKAFQKERVSKRYPLDYHTLTLATISFVTTTDGYILFGSRKATLNNHSITPIGGGVQPDEIEINTMDDIYSNMDKEIKEEIGLDNKFHKSNDIIGVIHAVERMIIFILFHTRLTVSKNEVASAFNKISQQSEHDKLLYIKISELRDFLSDKPDYLKAFGNLFLTVSK